MLAIGWLTSNATKILLAVLTFAATETARRVFQLWPVKNKSNERARRVFRVTDPVMPALRDLYENDDVRIPREELVAWDYVLYSVETSLLREFLVGDWWSASRLIVGERYNSKSKHFDPKGLLYFHTSWIRGLAFGSILKTDKRSVFESDPEIGVPSPLTFLMTHKMRQWMRGPLWLMPIHNIIFEIEDPKVVIGNEAVRNARKRASFFRKLAAAKEIGYFVYHVNWAYVQPLTDPDELDRRGHNATVSLKLIYACQKDREHITVRELKRILRFNYLVVYASIVNRRDPSHTKYAAYLKRFADEQCKRIDDEGIKRVKLNRLGERRAASGIL